MDFETGEDMDTGKVRRGNPRLSGRGQVAPQRRPVAPQRRLGLGRAARIQVTGKAEGRAGLMLATDSVPGNQGLVEYHGQKTSQHGFICTGLKVQVLVANDQALAADPTCFAEWSSPPMIKGQSVMDGKLVLAANKSKVINFARPINIMEQTGLTPGNVTLVKGTANMEWSVAIQYLTELDSFKD